MITQQLNGLDEARFLEGALKNKWQSLQKENDRAPHLAILLVGDHAPSLRYIAAKKEAAERIEFQVTLHHLSAHTKEKELLDLLGSLNQDPYVHGIIVQLPTPDGVLSFNLLNTVDPSKDIDGLTAKNAGMLFQGAGAGFTPCTPLAVMHLMNLVFKTFEGLDVVVIGQSFLVGRPLSLLLSRKGATVTMVQKETKDIKRYTKEADAVIVAVGQPLFFDHSYFSDKTCVIDVGINQDPHEKDKLVGDVDFKSCLGNVRALTPVPGGVGPLTVAYLLSNLLGAWETAQKRLR